MLRVELTAMAPHRRDTRLGFKYFESSRWEALVQDGIAIEEQNIRSESPLPPSVAGARCGLDSTVKNDDLGTEIAGHL
jgi:hypothetical protein